MLCHNLCVWRVERDYNSMVIVRRCVEFSRELHDMSTDSFVKLLAELMVTQDEDTDTNTAETFDGKKIKFLSSKLVSVTTDGARNMVAFRWVVLDHKEQFALTLLNRDRTLPEARESSFMRQSCVAHQVRVSPRSKHSESPC